MTRRIGSFLVAGMAFAVGPLATGAAAQQPAAVAAPEPKLPPMPSMEGQQGDVSKPVTQIPPRKKPQLAEKKLPEKKGPDKKAPVNEVRPAEAHKKR